MNLSNITYLNNADNYLLPTWQLFVNCVSNSTPPIVNTCKSNTYTDSSFRKLYSRLFYFISILYLLKYIDMSVSLYNKKY